MQITIRKVDELDPDVLAAWSHLLRSGAVLTTPFYSLQYVQALAAVRPDVRVAVMYDRPGGEPFGFFPFQRDRLLGVGEPAGSPISDYEGPIIPAACQCDAAELLRGCGLRGLRFTTAPDSCLALASATQTVRPSPVMDIGEDTDLGPGERRKLRKLEREVGPVRFDPDVRDEQSLERLMALKSAFYRHMNSPDLFARPWICRLVRHLHGMRNGPLRSRLSVLYVGGELAAAHLGLCYEHVWHWWFPCYDRRFARYSPGLLMLLMMARHAPSLGLREIHFGEGDDFFKHRLKTRQIPVREGCLGWAPPVSPLLRHEPLRWLKRQVLQTRLGPLALRVYHTLGKGQKADDASRTTLCDPEGNGGSDDCSSPLHAPHRAAMAELSAREGGSAHVPPHR